MGTGRATLMCGFFSMCIFFLIGTTLFLTACGHYVNWWCLFAPLSMILSMMVPAICFGYQSAGADMLNWDMEMDLSTFKSCRDMGWVIMVMMAIFSTSIPAIVWYNEPLSLPWPGVLWIMSGITFWWWTYLVVLRVFVFKRTSDM
jgi:hypothetical protein